MSSEGRAEYAAVASAEPYGAIGRWLDRVLWERPELRKVPRVIAVFWAIKILSTALGESTSDYLVHNMVPEAAVLLGFAGLVVALVLQFRADRYVAWIYWLAVVIVAIFGTMAADVLHIQFHVPYVASTMLFGAILAVVFYLWNQSERTLSIHTIYNPRREVFYWATVMATFALGTAAGDFTATTLGLGYFWSGVMFAVLIALPGIAYVWLRLNPVACFWTAYVLTRPLGASFADWNGKSKALGGLDYGDGLVSFVLAVLIVALVAYLSVTRVDVEVEARARS